MGAPAKRRGWGGECPTSKISLPAVEVVPSNLAAVVRKWSTELDEMKKKVCQWIWKKNLEHPVAFQKIQFIFFNSIANPLFIFSFLTTVEGSHLLKYTLTQRGGAG